MPQKRVTVKDFHHEKSLQKCSLSHKKNLLKKKCLPSFAIMEITDKDIEVTDGTIDNRARNHVSRKVTLS
jgi:hypothetical protein